MAQTAHSQFEQAYQLVVVIHARWRVTRRGMSLANYCAKGSISVTWQSRSTVADALEVNWNSVCASSKKPNACWAALCKRQGKNFDIDELEALHQELEARIASLSDSVSNAREERMALRQEQEQLQSRIQSLMQRAPVWLAAQTVSTS
ncbi:hypothetical protein ACLK11_05280 [Escherichia coli]